MSSERWAQSLWAEPGTVAFPGMVPTVVPLTLRVATPGPSGERMS
jgi:hypothetical protein